MLLELSAGSATVRLSLWSTKSALEFGTSGCRLCDDWADEPSA